MIWQLLRTWLQFSLVLHQPHAPEGRHTCSDSLYGENFDIFACDTLKTEGNCFAFSSSEDHRTPVRLYFPCLLSMISPFSMKSFLHWRTVRSTFPASFRHILLLGCRCGHRHAWDGDRERGQERPGPPCQESPPTLRQTVLAWGWNQ